MEWLDSIVSVANDYLWSYVLIVMLVGVGLMFTVRTKLVQIGEASSGSRPRLLPVLIRESSSLRYGIHSDAVVFL